MKGKFPAFQFYPDSWLSSTSVSLMTPAEEGAYLRLLCHAWQAEDCGLPADDTALAQLSRLNSQWSKSAHKILAKFERIGDRLFNPRLVEERQKQIEWREKSAAGGRKSGKSRSKGGSRVVQPPFENGSHLVRTKNEPTPQPKPNISSSSSISECVDTKNVSTHEARVREIPRTSEVTQPSQRFEEFWTLYPRKFGKDDSAREWVEYVSVDNEEQVFACLKRYLESAEVLRGAVMNAASGTRDLGWLAKCARDKWQSDWGKAREPPKRAMSVTERAKLAALAEEREKHGELGRSI